LQGKIFFPKFAIDFYSKISVHSGVIILIEVNFHQPSIFRSTRRSAVKAVSSKGAETENGVLN